MRRAAGETILGEKIRSRLEACMVRREEEREGGAGLVGRDASR
jgi:hypothetical protein